MCSLLCARPAQEPGLRARVRTARRHAGRPEQGAQHPWQRPGLKIAGLLQLNSLGIAVTAKTNQFALGLSYDIVIAGMRVTGSPSVSVNGSPMDIVANLLRDMLLGNAKAKYPTVKQYLP